MARQLIVRTVQLAQWRKVPGHELLDVTVKSGDLTFSPTWDMVNSLKKGYITEDDFMHAYMSRMRDTQRTNEARWLEVCAMGAVTLGCYCKPDTFCHRHILVAHLMVFCAMHDVEVLYEGEVL